MKQAILLIFIGFVIGGCQKNNSELPNSYEVSQNPSWGTEPFKTNYSIQFPAGYTGSMTGFEGNIFFKRNMDSSFFSYFYSNLLHCFDFRDTLANTNLRSISALFNNVGPSVTLDQRIEFTRNHSLIGIFYHTNTAQSLGRLFWKDENFFKEAMDVSFKSQNLPEVIEIIRTIR